METALILAGLTILALLACLANENISKKYYRELARGHTEARR